MLAIPNETEQTSVWWFGHGKESAKKEGFYRNTKERLLSIRDTYKFLTNYFYESYYTSRW